MNDTPYSSISGKLIQRLANLITKLLILNLLTLLCSLPIITTGAALTAMHGCLLKMARGSDLQARKEYFQLFRANFKQSTLLWLPFLLIFAAAQVNILILLTAPGVLPEPIVIPAISAAIIAYFMFQYVMPVQAHFENTPLLTLRTAAILSASYFPRTVLMAVLWAIPTVLFWKATITWPLVFMFGLSLPGYLSAKLYSKIFLKLEENEI